MTESQKTPNEESNTGTNLPAFPTFPPQGAPVQAADSGAVPPPPIGQVPGAVPPPPVGPSAGAVPPPPVGQVAGSVPPPPALPSSDAFPAPASGEGTAGPLRRDRSDRPTGDAIPEASNDAAPPMEPANAAPAASPVLDAGTYTKLIEARSSARLALDGVWHQISPRYAISQMLQHAIALLLVVIAALVLGFVLDQTWVWIPAGLFIVIDLIALVVIPRQAKAIGYMLRADDIVFRKGILWQRMIAVPYGRMQLVDITQGPLDRAFGISQLKMVTAAATTGVQIPGLSQEAAEALRDTLIDVAETRRTGL